MRELALITGASSGLGTCYARLHAQLGGDLILVARREERLLQLKEELESTYAISVYVLAKDLSSPTAPEEIYVALQEANLHPDILINNAGLGGQGDFIDRSIEDDIQLISVDVLALVRLTKRFLPDFLARGTGRILNVSSAVSLFPGGPGQATYFASKAFVTNFSSALAEELQGTGVTVTCVLPGGLKTGFADAANLQGTGLGKQLSQSPEQVALESYGAMQQGKRRLLAGVTRSQRLLFALLPFLPTSFVLRQVHQLHQSS